MSEYIEREKLIADIKNKYCRLCEKLIEDYKHTKCRACWVDDMIDEIEGAPTAEVAEVKHGKWTECYEDFRKQFIGDKCSSCGFEHYGTVISHYHYCPNCGAKMDLEEENK